MESQPHRVNPDQQRFLNFESAYEFYKAPASAPPPPPGPLNNATKNSHTNEDAQLVSRILNSDNVYRTLGVNDTSSREEIHNAYRVLSAKLHPNFNKAPGSHVAFKKVNDAYDSLNLLVSVQNNNIAENGQNGPTRVGYRHTPDLFFLLFLAAVTLVLIIGSFVWPRGDEYRLEPSSGYNMPMKTEECGIRFYVESVDGFDTRYPVGSQDRTQIEEDIGCDYVDYVRNNGLCRRERQVHSLYPNAPTPNCDKLKCLGKDQG